MKITGAPSSFGKWLAGIAASVIAGLIIWWFTQGNKANNYDEYPEDVMDISGVWLTPYRDLSYNITQDNYNYNWIIRESGVSGSGTIEGRTFISNLKGERVSYEVRETDPEGNPVVLFTTDPKYTGVILFRTCDNLKKFLFDFDVEFPELKSKVHYVMQNIPNPTCPNILELKSNVINH